MAADLFEFDGKTYLVTSDYYNDFLEPDHLRSPSSLYVIRKLKDHLARHGISEQLVTDNGSPLRNAISRSSPEIGTLNDSQGNGKAESAVKEAKKLSESAERVDQIHFLPY